MALKVPNIGLVYILDLLRVNFPSMRVRLFQNNYIPVAGSVRSDFVESTFSGYVDVAYSSWSSAVVALDHSKTTCSELVFTRTLTGAPQSIYGYFVDNGAGLLVLAERDPAGVFVVTNAGDSYRVTPQFTMVSEF